MARERGQVDKEAGMSMRKWGWSCYKKRDAMVCPYCHKLILPSGESGTFDFPKVYLPHRQEYVDIEVKAGDTSLAFSEFRDEQRDWAESHGDTEKWMWIGVGRRIGAKEYPRKTWLMPLCVFYELESELERKSIPHDCPRLNVYELEWEGDSIWRLPEAHPINERK